MPIGQTLRSQSDAIFLVSRESIRHLVAIYFGSPFSRYLTFHTLTSDGRKKVLSVCEKNVSAFSCNSEHYTLLTTEGQMK